MRPTALVLALVLSCVTITTNTGCGAVGPAVANAIAALVSAFDWLAPKVDSIATVVTAAEAGGLIPGPAAADVLKRVAQLQALIAESRAVAQDGKRVAPEVIARIEQLYAELLPLVRPLGVQEGGSALRLGAPPGTVVVPSSSEVSARLAAAR